MPKLDFLVIGAQKSGTTTLWNLLRDHPQLAFAKSKEVAFFTDERLFPNGIEWYLRTYFEDAQEDCLRGTVTPPYMSGVSGPHRTGLPIETVAARIATGAPDVKLIALLRDPIERAISHYKMSARRGLETRPVVEAMTQQLTPGALLAARNKPSETNGYVVWGEYGRILDAYRTHFPPEQFLLVPSAELSADPGGVVARILEFLEVDATWRPGDLWQRHLVGGNVLRVDQQESEVLVERLRSELPPEFHELIQILIEEWNTLSGSTEVALPAAVERKLREHFASDGLRLAKLFDLTVPWAAYPAVRARAPMLKRPDVSILIPAHDTPEEVEELLASIVSNTDERYEIVVIDNGSSPTGSSAHTALAETYGAGFIGLPENLSFSVVNNIGIRHCRADDIALVNSDVVVTPNWLTNLRRALHSASNIGAVGPRASFAPGPQGAVWLDDSSPEGVQRFGSFFNHPDETRWFDVDWLAGFLILARRSALVAVGGFDERIDWFAGEDINLSKKLQEAEWRTVCAGDTFVYHAGHQTFLTISANRSATRFGRPAAHLPVAVNDNARLVDDGKGHVFEVQDGVASHLETWHAALLVKAGRGIEMAEPGELEQLPLGPPVSVCRARGTDEVFVLHRAQRRPVRGHPDRIRRQPNMSMSDPDKLRRIPEGPAVHVEDALPSVPEMRPLLPRNPVEIVPERLASVGRVAGEIAAALEGGVGYALVRLGNDEVLVLNHGIWPAGPMDRAGAGAGQDPLLAAATLRRAIVGAAAVGVITDRSRFAGAPLLENLLFHYDLYPRLMCSEDINFALMGIDRVTRGIDRVTRRDDPPLRALLEGRRVALVCPTVIARCQSPAQREFQASRGFDVRRTIGLDDLGQVDTAVEALAAERGEYDVVLAVGRVPTKPLCARIARDLDVVALDMGTALGGIVHPRYQGGRNALLRLRGEVDAYLAEVQAPPPARAHENEGRLVQARGEPAIYYIERGAAREVLHPALLGLFDHEPLEVDASVLLATPLGAPICPVREPFTTPYALVNGKKVPLRGSIRTIVVDDTALESLPLDDRELRI